MPDDQEDPTLRGGGDSEQEISQRNKGFQPQQKSDEKLNQVHPDNKDKHGHEGHPPEFAPTLRDDRPDHRGPRQGLAGFTSPAHFAQPDGNERPDQCEAGRKGIREIAYSQGGQASDIIHRNIRLKLSSIIRIIPAPEKASLFSGA